MTNTNHPLRGHNHIGGGFAAADQPVRRARYGAAPPASRMLRIAYATGLRPALDPGASATPWGSQPRAGTGLPRVPRGTQSQDRKPTRSQQEVTDRALLHSTGRPERRRRNAENLASNKPGAPQERWPCRLARWGVNVLLAGEWSHEDITKLVEHAKAGDVPWA